MQNRLNLVHCLKVFNAVHTQGKVTPTAQEAHYVHQDFEAWSDFDGYTCFLRHGQTTLTLMFHGKYQLQCPTEQALHEFERHLLKFKF